MVNDKRWMIYGVYGYTGRLIATEARRRSMVPIAAGRSAGRVVEVSATLGLKKRIFGLDNAQLLRQRIEDCDVVLHCAGPFSRTARQMMDACVDTGTHYLDVNGEIDVFEYGQSLTERAAAAQVVLCSGVGFDVIPTDCLAAALADKMPDASHLALGFDTNMRLSPGTAKTSFEGLAKGGRVRRSGELISVPLAYHTREIDFGRGPRLGVTIPWGDVATAYYTTGIGNIDVYLAANDKLVARLRRLNSLRGLLSFGPVQRFVKRRIAKRTVGPDAAARAATETYVWGEVRNADGQILSGRLRTANGYEVTVHGALACVDRLLRSQAPAGSTTPSRLMGSDFATRQPGASEFDFN